MMYVGHGAWGYKSGNGTSAKIRESQGGLRKTAGVADIREESTSNCVRGGEMGAAALASAGGELVEDAKEGDHHRGVVLAIRAELGSEVLALLGA